jgi:AraC-like DNA-binding protein
LFAEQSNYRPLKMAELCQISLRHLERQFKTEIGVTPRNWLKKERLRSALRMLPEARSVKEVSYTLGYCQLSQFCREFKIGFGLTPSAFRQLGKPEQDQYLAREAEAESSEVREPAVVGASKM